MGYHTNQVQVLCEGCTHFKECKRKKTFDFTVTKSNEERLDYELLQPMMYCEEFERNGLTIV